MLFWLKYTLNTNGELIALSYMIDKICSYMRYEIILNVHIYSNIFFHWQIHISTVYEMLFINYCSFFFFVKQFMHQTLLQLKNKDRTRTLVHIYIFIDTIWLKYIPNGNRPLYCSQTSLQSSTPSSKHHCKR